MIEIVPISPEHIESFHRTLDTVAKERRYLAFLEAPSLESTRGFILGAIEEKHPRFVALSKAQVVGWCDVTPQSNQIHAHAGILGMGLLPPFRGQGIGYRLITRTLDAAKAMGLSRIALTVRENNKNAIGLYQKAGFAAEGLQRHAVRVDSAYENVVLMALLF